MPLGLAGSRAGIRSPGLPSSMHGGVFIYQTPSVLVDWTLPSRSSHVTGKELGYFSVMYCMQDRTDVPYRDGLFTIDMYGSDQSVNS